MRCVLLIPRACHGFKYRFMHEFTMRPLLAGHLPLTMSRLTAPACLPLDACLCAEDSDEETEPHDIDPPTPQKGMRFRGVTRHK